MQGFSTSQPTYARARNTARCRGGPRRQSQHSLHACMMSSVSKSSLNYEEKRTHLRSSPQPCTRPSPSRSHRRWAGPRRHRARGA